MLRPSRSISAGGLALLLALGGCASIEPYEYESTVGELRPGRGLLTREQGEFVLYSSDRKLLERGEKPKKQGD